MLVLPTPLLVGVGPETAQALFATGADLSQLLAQADLRSAVAYALHTIHPRTSLS